MPSSLKPLINRCLLRCTGSPAAVRFLERLVNKSLYLAGVGSGDTVEYSGERVVGRILAEFGPGPLCLFDVGGNNGQYVQMLRESLGPREYLIHCFEPGSACFGRLRERFGSDPRVRLNNLALGDRQGQATLYFDQSGSGLASLTKRDLGYLEQSFDQSETVAIDTLDGYCAAQGIGHIHLLKIDVEGHELEVLLGGRRMLEEGRVDLVTFEFGGTNLDTRVYFRDLFQFFAGLGMEIHRILPAQRLYPIPAYHHRYEQFTTTNYLAARRGIKLPR